MTVRPPTNVEQLVTDLSSDDITRRDSAVARLRLAGSRAVARLAALATSTATVPTRAAALTAMAGIDDERCIDAGLQALTEADTAIQLAAIEILRDWVSRETGTRILEALAPLATSQSPAPVAQAALEALTTLPADVVEPILEQARQQEHDPAPAFEQAADVRAWLDQDDLALSHLHTAITQLREREAREPLADQREHWRVARGAVHAALARRDSRVALYDLREAFAAARAPLPLDFVTTAAAIGDASCLEPMAAAWAALPEDTWWRARLAEAAAAIVKRAKLTGRSALLKRVRERWPGFA